MKKGVRARWEGLNYPPAALRWFRGVRFSRLFSPTYVYGDIAAALKLEGSIPRAVFKLEYHTELRPPTTPKAVDTLECDSTEGAHKLTRSLLIAPVSVRPISYSKCGVFLA